MFHSQDRSLRSSPRCRKALHVLSLPPVLDAFPHNFKALALRRVCRDLRAAVPAPAGSRVDASQWAPFWAVRERWESFSPQQRRQQARLAGGIGDVVAVEWLSGKRVAGRQLWLECGVAAAAAGHLELLHHMAERGYYARTERFCNAAAEAGHVPVLQLFRAQQRPCPWDSRVCYEVAEAGHVHVLEWVREQQLPCRWDTSLCVTAAMHGQLAVLQWLRRQQPPCPWNARVRTAAAREGHVDVLDWAVANGCPVV